MSDSCKNECSTDCEFDKKLMEGLKSCDTNGDGKINKEDIKNYLISHKLPEEFIEV
jgi:Ca2+-binding EF-hand superfamily protein